jgi:hypothetical protein
MVLMADGSEKPIQDIVVGDKVLGENELTGEREINTVTTHFVHEGSFPMLVVNGTLHVTAEHRIKIERDSTISWIGAGELLVGDVLVGTEDAVPVVSIEPGEVLHRVYNLTTFPSHTYFAGGVLVHNIKNFDMNFN